MRANLLPRTCPSLVAAKVECQIVANLIVRRHHRPPISSITVWLSIAQLLLKAPAALGQSNLWRGEQYALSGQLLVRQAWINLVLFLLRLLLSMAGFRDLVLLFLFRAELLALASVWHPTAPSPQS
ncbi:unnamed protein product [Effrenium voratum]|uniref:Uncharacterized protein n=1 Tax=Effrenium voratum TaxID=2562239 RepID=A0AA36N4U8_9DINO|nr:unnamed protein product [Effrenium voratum]CAJ1434056.1 unnamed protein product [Effrenium voratum]